MVFEDFYYGITQQEIFCSKALDPSNYIGSTVEFADSHGDLTFRNLHVDAVNTLVKAQGDLKVTVDGCECVSALKTADLNGGRLTINGEEIENG